MITIGKQGARLSCLWYKGYCAIRQRSEHLPRILAVLRCLIKGSFFETTKSCYWLVAGGKKMRDNPPLMKEITICYPPDRICSFICALFHMKPAIILPVTYVVTFL